MDGATCKQKCDSYYNGIESSVGMFKGYGILDCRFVTPANPSGEVLKAGRAPAVLGKCIGGLTPASADSSVIVGNAAVDKATCQKGCDDFFNKQSPTAGIHDCTWSPPDGAGLEVLRKGRMCVGINSTVGLGNAYDYSENGAAKFCSERNQTLSSFGNKTQYTVQVKCVCK